MKVNWDDEIPKSSGKIKQKFPNHQPESDMKSRKIMGMTSYAQGMYCLFIGLIVGHHNVCSYCVCFPLSLSNHRIMTGDDGDDDEDVDENGDHDDNDDDEEADDGDD